MLTGPLSIRQATCIRNTRLRSLRRTIKSRTKCPLEFTSFPLTGRSRTGRAIIPSFDKMRNRRRVRRGGVDGAVGCREGGRTQRSRWRLCRLRMRRTPCGYCALGLPQCSGCWEGRRTMCAPTYGILTYSGWRGRHEGGVVGFSFCSREATISLTKARKRGILRERFFGGGQDDGMFLLHVHDDAQDCPQPPLRSGSGVHAREVPSG